MNYNQNKAPITIGIDIGRVIIGQDTDQPQQFFQANYLHTPALPHAFETIQAWVAQFGTSHVHLVSKCGVHIQKRSLAWLNAHRFFEQTGILQQNVHFCIKRHQKRLICLQHGINTFVDDRFTVLQHLDGLSHLFLFQPEEKELQAFKAAETTLPIRVINDWLTLRKQAPFA